MSYIKLTIRTVCGDGRYTILTYFCKSLDYLMIIKILRIFLLPGFRLSEGLPSFVYGYYMQRLARTYLKIIVFMVQEFL